MKNIRSLFFLFFVLIPLSLLSGHCDTMDGPVVADAKSALLHNNVNYVLKWVKAEAEEELKAAFDLSIKVRGLNDDAKLLADKYFFETVVRLHRQGEGVAYTGIKPSGTPVDEKIVAADKAIETGDLSLLSNMIEKDRTAELKKKFDRVMALKDFDVNNVREGREYVESYVQFFHYAEGDGEGHESVHAEH